MSHGDVKQGATRSRWRHLMVSLIRSILMLSRSVTGSGCSRSPGAPHRLEDASRAGSLARYRNRQPVFEDSPQLRFTHGSDWLQLSLTSASDLAVLASLASVAIQADARGGCEARNRNSPCPQATGADRMPVLARHA